MNWDFSYYGATPMQEYLMLAVAVLLVVAALWKRPV